LFIDDSVSQIERKLKVISKEIRRKENKEKMYGDKERIFYKYWKRHVVIVMREMEKNKIEKGVERKGNKR